MTDETRVPALRVSGLVRRYGGRAVVGGVDLRVERGEIYGFLGPNGAGKTTTMRMILGLVRRDAGTIEVFGQTDPATVRARVGGIIEGPRFYPYLSALENLRIFAAYSGGLPDARLEELLELVRLKDRRLDRVATFSLGMKQRLGIAQALLGGPDLLLLDEPANGLDPAGMKEIRDLMAQLKTERQVAVLVSSHLLGEVDRICDRIGILKEGRMVAEGRPSELVADGESLEDCFLRLTDATHGGQIR